MHRKDSPTMAVPKMPKSPIDDLDIGFNSSVETILKVENTEFTPSYGDFRSSSADLFANLDGDDDIVVEVGKVSTIKCGFSMHVPFGYKVIINPNEILVKKGLVTLNGPIGSYKTGELEVIVGNLGGSPISICHGDKFAQMMIEPSMSFKFVRDDDY